MLRTQGSSSPSTTAIPGTDEPCWCGCKDAAPLNLQRAGASAEPPPGLPCLPSPLSCRLGIVCTGGQLHSRSSGYSVQLRTCTPASGVGKAPRTSTSSFVSSPSIWSHAGGPPPCPESPPLCHRHSSVSKCPWAAQVLASPYKPSGDLAGDLENKGISLYFS